MSYSRIPPQGLTKVEFAEHMNNNYPFIWNVVWPTRVCYEKTVEAHFLSGTKVNAIANQSTEK
ncbi:MAG: hypothetical protein AAFU78_21645 [Cyanobacteria bacterium J06633_2]